MCRNIKPLFNFEPPVTEQDIRAASLQFVRKISGFNKPSKANETVFFAAVAEIAAVSEQLLSSLATNAPPRFRKELPTDRANRRTTEPSKRPFGAQPDGLDARAQTESSSVFGQGDESRHRPLASDR
jgi:hypothetical protein